MVRVGWLALALFAASCHEPLWVDPVKATAQIDPLVLDVGQVPVGDRHTVPVHIRNVGYVPFNALKAVSLRGNPVFQVEIEGGVGLVKPGEEKRVLVHFKPMREGPEEEAARIVTDADKDPEREVAIRGTGIPPRIGVEPALLDFQAVELDSTRELEVTIDNPIELPLLVSLPANAGGFSSDTGNVPPKSKRTLKARFSPTVVGDHAANIEVRACPTCTAIPIPMVGKAVESAFSFNPAPVPFEDIPVHQRTRSKTKATNILWRPVTLSGVSTSDVAFTPLTQDLAGRVVAPGESVELELEFAARTSGPKEGTLTLSYVSDRARGSRVGLDASGGRPHLALAPVAIDFGMVPVGSKVERVVRLTNAGVTGALHFRGVRAEGDTPHFGAAPPTHEAQTFGWSGGAWPALTAADLPMPPGDYLDVRVSFNPVAVGQFRATVHFQTDDVIYPERAIVVTGQSRESGPCFFRVLPEGRLAFGNVPAGTGAVLGFRFENTGDTECTVKDIHLSNDAGGKFLMPGGPIAGGVLIKDDAFSSQIAFRSDTPGEFHGELQITTNSTTTPTFRLPVHAVALGSCVTIAPNFLDFGPIRYDCAPVPRTALISNQCTAPLTVDRIDIGPGTSGQFSFVRRPGTPLSLAPGEGAEVEVTYARNVLGQHYNPLWVWVRGEPEPFLLPLLAETNHEGVQRDDFLQGTANEIDVLFVVSNTSTMARYQDRLRASIPGWIADAAAAGVSLRVGVTTTGLVERSGCPGGANGGEAGRLFPVDRSRSRIVDASSPTAATTLAANLAVGTCHNLTQGLETMRAALSSPLVTQSDDPRTAAPQDGNRGLLRPSARLGVVFLTDEDDHSGFSVESYVQFLQSLKGPDMGHRVSLYAIVPTDPACATAGPPGPRLAAVARATGGTVTSICRSGYDSVLDRLIHTASGPQSEFQLTQVPDETKTISVRVRGSTAPEGSWRFDPAQNAIVFEAASVPAPGDRISVRYRATCAQPLNPTP